MGEEQNVNENEQLEFIMQMINSLSDEEMRGMIQIGLELVMDTQIALVVDMEDADIPVDDPEPVVPAVVIEQEVPPEIQDPLLLWFGDVIIVEILNISYDPNDPYIFNE